MKTAKLVPAPILKTLAYVCKLNSSAMNTLAEETYLEALKKGEHLFRSGFSDPSTFYLLSGEVSLVAEGKDDEVIGAKTPEAKKPLAREKPRKVSAVAKTDVIFIRISDEALAEVTNDDSDGEIDEASVEKNILNDITDALKNNKLIIPSLPDIALQIRKAVQDPNSDAVKISKIIQSDPALTARIIQVANSPIYRGSSTITGCRMAVSRMGVQITRDLVTGCTLQTLFESDSEMLQQRMAELWKYSIHIAALCAVIARLSRKVDEDYAMLAGLLHNIGSLPILAYAEKYPVILSDPDMLNGIIEKVGGKIGAMILEKWHFDKEFITVATEAHDWERDPGPEVDYCDIVILAQLYSFIDTPQMDQHPLIDEVPAFSKLPFGKLGPKMTLKIVDTAQQDIEEIKSVLGG